MQALINAKEWLSNDEGKNFMLEDKICKNQKNKDWA